MILNYDPEDFNEWLKARLKETQIEDKDKSLLSEAFIEGCKVQAKKQFELYLNIHNSSGRETIKYRISHKKKIT